MIRLLWKLRNEPGTLPSIMVRLRLLIPWRAVDRFFHRQANYRYEGISLKFKITSSVELERVRNKGQQFILQEFLGRLSPGDVYYDIGANIGIHTLPAAIMVGEQGLVVAFEPDAANYHRLLENADNNDLLNVIAFGVALGSTNQISMFYRHTNRVGEGGHSLIKRDSQKGGINRIPQTRLDDLVSLWGLPIPQFVKIDVEGTELSVLDGMRETLSNDLLHTLVCEVTSAGNGVAPEEITSQAVSELLADYGFVELSRQNSGSQAPVEDIIFVKSKSEHNAGS